MTDLHTSSFLCQTWLRQPSTHCRPSTLSPGIKSGHCSTSHTKHSTHFLPPSTRKCNFYNPQSSHMNAGVENSRTEQKGIVRIVLFDWKQLVGLHYRDVLRIDEGKADFRLQMGINLFHSLCWYSRRWFINPQLCVGLTHHRTSFWMDRELSCSRFSFLNH